MIDGPQARRWSPWLVVAAGVTAVVLAGAAVLRLSVVEPATPLPGRLLPVLVATAILLVALLAAPHAPRLAWPLLTIAAMLAALEVVTVVRSLESFATGPAWRDLVVIAGAAIVGATAVGAGYAGLLRWPRGIADRGLQLLLWLGIAATIVALTWTVAQAGRTEGLAATPGELTPLRVATRFALAAMVGAFLLGLGRDVAPAARRAADRLRVADSGAGQGRLWAYLALLADELLPARPAERRRLAEAERARLAADLHAFVLPDLRRAAAAAESAGAPAAMQVDLRRALEDVEQLMHDRQSIVLEQFGLVAGLEWLAERTEERSPLRVELELDGSVPEGPDALDRSVARAAFRISLLGLDNVVRHAGARTATLRLSRDAAGLRLVIEDDGSEAAQFEPLRGRGLADMRAAATGSGGSVVISAGPGVRIEARWPGPRVAENHAARAAGPTDGSGGSRR